MSPPRKKRAARKRARKASGRKPRRAEVPPTVPEAPAVQLGVTAYARHRGVRLRAVQDAIERGRLSASVSGPAGRRVIDVALADREWEAADPAQAERGRARSGSKTRPRPAASSVESSSDEATDVTVAADYYLERARREKHAAEKIRLEVLRLKGELVEVAEVNRRAFEAARRVRDALIALPNRLGPVIAAEVDPGEVARMLESELVQVLEAVSKELRADADSLLG